MTMNERYEKWQIFGIYLLLIIFVMICGSSMAQTSVTDRTFKYCEKGKAVVEFWADWNKDNMCTEWLVDIEGAKYYIMDVNSDKAKEYKIKVLPTLIILNDGIEVDRFEGNIQFQLCPRRTPKKVQAIINELDNLNRY
jgi:thiol-disulfide isomerase/thioredoxin